MRQWLIVSVCVLAPAQALAGGTATVDEVPVEHAQKIKDQKIIDEAKKRAKIEAAKRAAELRAKNKKVGEDRLEMLLDKDPTRKGVDANGRPTAGASVSSDRLLAMREQDLLGNQIRKQIERCANFPGAGEMDIPDIELQLTYKEDGTLANEPQVLNTAKAKAYNPKAYDIARVAAVSAVKNCSPLTLDAKIFPHSAWRSFKFVFPWAEMLGIKPRG
jgi:hypothetical protein